MRATPNSAWYTGGSHEGSYEPALQPPSPMGGIGGVDDDDDDAMSAVTRSRGASGASSTIGGAIGGRNSPVGRGRREGRVSYEQQRPPAAALHLDA